MLLIQLSEWYGPGRNFDRPGARPEPQNKMVTFATRLPLVDALRRINIYERAFAERYGTFSPIVEFTLIGHQHSDDIPDQVLDDLQCLLVEGLAQKKEDF